MRFLYLSFAYQKSHNHYIDKRVLKVKGEAESVSLYLAERVLTTVKPLIILYIHPYTQVINIQSVIILAVLI